MVVGGDGGPQAPQDIEQDVLPLAGVVEGAHRRLLEREQPVAAVVVAPGLEPMVLRQPHLAVGRGLVFLQADPDPERHLGHGGGPGAGLGKGVGRVRAPHQDRGNLSGGHGPDRFLQVAAGGQPVGGPKVQGLGPQHGVQQVRGQVGLRRHAVAAEHQRLASGARQVGQEGVPGSGRDPQFPGAGAGARIHARRQGDAVLAAQVPGQGESRPGQPRRQHGKAVVGLGAGEGHGPFQHPQAVHGSGRAAGPAPLGEFLDRHRILAGEEVGAQGEDHLGLAHAGLRRQVGAEGGAGGLLGGAGGRFEGQVPEPRQRASQLSHQGLAGGRFQGAGEQQHLPLGLAGAGQGLDHPAFGGLPAGFAAVQARRAQAVGIVQAQHVGHRPGRGLAPQPGVLVVAGDVDGPALPGLHQDGVGAGPLLEGGRVVVGHARHHLRRTAGIGDDAPAAAAGTGRAGGQRGGGAQQFQEPPAGQAGGRFRGSGRELVGRRFPGGGGAGAFIQGAPEAAVLGEAVRFRWGAGEFIHGVSPIGQGA